MYNLQKILNNQLAADRAKQMLTSPQITLGELILKLEIVPAHLPIVFDEPRRMPTGLCSWRGSYKELAITYGLGEGSSYYEQLKPDCLRDEFDDHDYKCPCGGSPSHDSSLPKKPKVSDLLSLLKAIQGKYFVGYKGGDFTMGKTTPVWVANYGETEGFKSGDTGYQAVVDVVEKNNKAVIITKVIDY